ncbi:MAG: FtsX-like permease family protein, partial [Chloroflexota bacterium]
HKAHSVADSSPLAIGDDVILNNDIQLPIIGRYRVIDDTIISPIDSLIMPSQTADSLDIAISDITIYAMVSADEEATLAKSIGAQFPNSMTLTRSDVMAEINGMFLNLLGFALAMSGLALLAGVMLIANVVSLAMLERYFELGLMKALGYTQKHILVMLAMEYSLIGLIASLMGLIGVQAVISFIILTQEASQGILFIRPTTAIVMILFGMALTMLTALITAWKPLRVRPSVVLKERVS